MTSFLPGKSAGKQQRFHSIYSWEVCLLEPSARHVDWLIMKMRLAINPNTYETALRQHFFSSADVIEHPQDLLFYLYLMPFYRPNETKALKSSDWNAGV